MKSDDNSLIRALKLNAGFSTVSALLMFAAGDWVARQLGLPGVIPVYTVAVFLLLFAAHLWNIARTRQIRTWEITGVIGGDIAWVIASVVLVFLYYESLTTAGLILVDVVSAAVLLFAVLQIRGLRAIRRAAST